VTRGTRAWQEEARDSLEVFPHAFRQDRFARLVIDNIPEGHLDPLVLVKLDRRVVDELDRRKRLAALDDERSHAEGLCRRSEDVSVSKMRSMEERS
jgi:hypothetical protein